ncbi:Sir2 family NAD-dependent protein deacetylase [Mycetocola reblochoni]|nr:Sir2 family NAD-dependent protein deacetylase [Mycetocola reblochoni]RLP69580.1 NAD-dependent deacetylase [Mycetocola reblochoni]
MGRATSLLDGATAVDAARGLLHGRRIAVITGAGVSTDSGIPDYRGEGSEPRNPMTFQQFMASADARRRYWAGSHQGWRRFRAARPNPTHTLLADWERDGLLSGVVTQNVDGLHAAAGSSRLVELHGTMSQVVCTACGQMFAREDIAGRLLQDNPWLPGGDGELHPDGDAEVGDVSGMVVPSCTVCGGILKPDVVFFGEYVPVDRFALASDIVHAADALLIVGSSLAVNSAVRLLDRARRRRVPVVIVNRGATKGDAKADVRIEGGAAETLAALDPR